ncbi:hypothetical protein ACWEKT_26650 [Nocardia takedensis]
MPTAIRSDGNRVAYAAVSPRNGTIQWQDSFEQIGSSKQFAPRGIGTLITTYESGPVVDAYTGTYITLDKTERNELGTDGRRLAVAVAVAAQSGQELVRVTDSTANGSEQSWEIKGGGMAAAVGGKLYLGPRRLL